ncbi:hypothetical protein QOZ88_14900 [Blastococcus sp. BMG 814]|uniref:Uncharacterized protein n=1 Tax=Blastococcus carthaginiensis TaxID=3050034 RepID=A0ABT9IFK8_9ACTN|nr:hypothetical protein [Blastococcus carthaginiensis]MDP5183924.1 hypothetical protein [Blastococcus carthaginiensis]
MGNPSSGFVVRVEHLPDRSYRLWLQTAGTPLDLGTVQRSRDLYPAAHARVAAHAGVDPESLAAVELDTPRPPYYRQGQAVLVREDDGRLLPGYVVFFAQGGFHLDTPEGIGIYAPEDIDFDPPPGAITYPGRHSE